MSPPNSPHRPARGASALSLGLKVFLSASVLFVGTIGTFPFLLPAPVTSPMGEQVVAAAIPVDEALPANLDTLPIKTLPSIAKHSEKVAQAYPEPILSPVTPTTKTEQPLPEAGAESPAPSVSAPLRKFVSIHPFTASTTALIAKTPTAFSEQPKSIDSSKIADTLLPMFHFAENLKPLSREKAERTPPENPFRQIQVDVPVPFEDKKLLPLRSLVELRPLRLAEPHSAL